MHGFPTRSHLDLVSSTEMGTVTEALPKEMNGEWEWFKITSLIKPHFVPDGHGAYELVVEVGAILRSSVRSFADGLLTTSHPVHSYLPGLCSQHQNRRCRWLLIK